MNKQNIIDKIHAMSASTMVEHLGIKITDIGQNFISGKMPVEGRTKQIRNFKKILLQNTSKLKNQISDNNDALMKHIERINEQVGDFVDQMINEELEAND